MDIDIQLEDFLPKYPNIENTSIEPFMNPYPDFYNSIYSKYEFYSLKLKRTEPRPLRGEQYNHQRIITRFLSAHTMYNKLLLVHEMGTGKSCSAFGAIEEIKNTTPAFKRALVLTRGPRILSNLMKELAYVCTVDRYVPDELQQRLTEKERVRHIKKMVSTFYDFNTFDKFSKLIQRMSDKELSDTFSNMIIMVDEVHNLRLHGKSEESRMYNQIWRLLHIPKNTKVIIMSGTPMKDDASEIAAILNLILPRDKQLPVGSEFTSRYFNKHGSGISMYTTIRPERILELKGYMKGIVSYLKAMTSDDVMVRYAGELYGKLKHFKVVPSKMSDFQSASYTKAYSIDVSSKSDIEHARYDTTLATGIYSNSRQAGLFVFPDGAYGKQGFDNSFNKTVHNRITRYAPKDSFRRLMGDTTAETIKNISRYSAIYASIISSILKNPTKLHFIYNSFVHGSGAIVLGKLLELVGFRSSWGMELDGGSRYAVLTNSTVSQSHVERIIKRFNASDNMNGEYIRVIIGSRILAEGITLKNVQEIHIATPHWNYSELAQAIARGIRLESHRDLIEDGQIPHVTIYQHVSIPVSTTPSIDLEMYELCEAKDISIKNVERLLKETAVDCALFYDRNTSYVDAKDGSRECDYNKCNYKCDGVDTLVPAVLDYSTYNLYYKSETRVSADISKLFETCSVYILDEIIQKLSSKYDVFDIISTLGKMIQTNTVLKNKLGFNSYLRERNNVYFLVDRIIAWNDFFSNIYVDNPIIFDTMPFSEAADAVYLHTIQTSDDESRIQYAFDRLSLNLKRVFIETLLELRIANSTFISPVMDIIYKHIEPMVMRDGKAYKIFDSLICINAEGDWELCEDEEDEVIIAKDTGLPEEDDDEEYESKLATYNYTGQLNPKTEQFCIKQRVEVSKVKKDVRVKRTGKVCKTWTKIDLLDIILRLGIEYGDNEILRQKGRDTIIEELRTKVKPEEKNLLYDMTKLSDEDLIRARYFVEAKSNTILCDVIQKFMRDNYLLYQSEDCGVQGRKKKE